MNRRDFLLQSILAGVLPSLGSLLSACGTKVGGRYDNFEVTFDGRVVIVGAGASGLAAGYLLQRYGIDFEILEASPRFGGRVLRADTFADFPIDLGAEWIHGQPELLAKLLDDPSLDATVDLIPYAPDTFHVRDGNTVRKRNWAANYYYEYKFHRTTWYGFLERFVVPTIASRITYDSPVSEIEVLSNGVQLTTEPGQVINADRVLLTVPIRVLQDRLINFTPALPETKVSAIDAVHVPHGIKVFLEFERRFYPDILLDGRLLESGAFDKLYYDAAFRKGSPRNVLGLFWVADNAAELTTLPDDETIAQRVIDDLDRVFNRRASRHHLQHVVQNWSAEPYIRGAYSQDFSGSRGDVMAALRAPVDRRLFFSGEALSSEAQATVHGAMLSAYDAVEDILVL